MKRIRMASLVLVLLAAASCMMETGERNNIFDPNAVFYPKFSAGYPDSFVYYPSFQAMIVSVKANLPTEYFLVGVPTGESAPNVNEVMSGQKSGGAPATAARTVIVSNADVNIPIALQYLPTSAHDVYVVMKSPLYTNSPREVFKVALPVITKSTIGASIDGWYNAADIAAITSDAAGNVSAWNDKSGSARHMLQGTAGKQPKWSAAGLKNYFPGVVFDGTDDFLSLSAGKNLVNNVPGFTVCAVIRPNHGANDQEYFLASEAAALSSRVSLWSGGYQTDYKFTIMGERLDAESGVHAAGGVCTVGQPTILTGVYDFANAKALLYQSGSLIVSIDPFLTPGNSQASDSQQIVMSGNTSSYYFMGAIAELIVFRSALSSIDQAVVEEYLRIKWGL